MLYDVLLTTKKLIWLVAPLLIRTTDSGIEILQVNSLCLI